MQDYWFHFVRSVYDDPEEQPPKFGKAWSFFYETVGAAAAAIVILFFAFAFLFRGVGVQGESMEPTLHDGDWLAVSAISHVKPNDVVIITQPNSIDKTLVKRVIAMGGEKIRIDYLSGTVYVNDQPFKEKIDVGQMTPSGNMPMSSVDGITETIIIPDGQVFVLGDNRNNSLDSRFSVIGCIDEDYILGVARYRVYPFASLAENTIK